MRNSNWIKFFLWSGIASTVWYVAVNVYVPTRWPEYDWLSQTVSELSAIGAPTQILWNWLCLPFTLLSIAFSLGVLFNAGKDKRIKFTGGLLFLYSLLGLAWPLAPMHQRQVIAAGGATESDTMHIGLGIATELIFIIALLTAAKAFGRTFRILSFALLIVMIWFGALTFADAPNINKGMPTPYLGLWERINIAIFLIWIVMLASALLRKQTLTQRYA